MLSSVESGQFWVRYQIGCNLLVFLLAFRVKLLSLTAIQNQSLAKCGAFFMPIGNPVTLYWSSSFNVFAASL